MIEISPNTLYRPEDIEKMMGRFCLEKLRANGLRALAGWYLGEKILDCYQRAIAQKTAQRVASKKGGSNETGCEEEIKEDDFSERPPQFVLEKPQSNDLKSQLQEFQRQTEREQKSP